MNDLKNRLREQLYVELGDRASITGFHTVFEATWRELEHDAVRRAIEAFVGSSQLLKERYHFEPVFHAALNAVAQITVAGVFGHAPVSKAEYEERAKNIQRLITDLPIGLLQEGPQHG